jgi:hypothetical protein
MSASWPGPIRSARKPDSKARRRAFPLRFVDGAVYIGALKVGQIPPLF